MNINALLSPDDGATQGGSPNTATAGVRATSTQSPSPPVVVQRGTRPAQSKRTGSGLSQQLSRSPERHISPQLSTTSNRPVVLGAQQHQQQYYAPPIQAAPPIFRPTPPTSNPVQSPEQHSQYGYAQRPAVASRPLSNTQMETLAGMFARSNKPVRTSA